MIPEKAQARRGEPVIVCDDNGNECEGTIEFGDESTHIVSVYCERDGRSTGRVIIHDFSKLRPDPGGLRPVWASLEPKK